MLPTWVNFKSLNLPLPSPFYIYLLFLFQFHFQFYSFHSSCATFLPPPSYSLFPPFLLPIFIFPSLPFPSPTIFSSFSSYLYPYLYSYFLTPIPISSFPLPIPQYLPTLSVPGGVSIKPCPGTRVNWGHGAPGTVPDPHSDPTDTGRRCQAQPQRCPTSPPGSAPLPPSRSHGAKQERPFSPSCPHPLYSLWGQKVNAGTENCHRRNKNCIKPVCSH